MSVLQNVTVDVETKVAYVVSQETVKLVQVSEDQVCAYDTSQRYWGEVAIMADGNESAAAADAGMIVFQVVLETVPTTAYVLNGIYVVKTGPGLVCIDPASIQFSISRLRYNAVCSRLCECVITDRVVMC